MPICYCKATSKRTHQPCRARAMRGREVCYHHGGKSLRGFVHPNYKHGYYVKHGDMTLLLAFHAYEDALRKQQIEVIYSNLSSTMPEADTMRLLAACRVAIRRLQMIKPTPSLVAQIMSQRWDDVDE